jgi:hypothetical protein
MSGKAKAAVQTGEAAVIVSWFAARCRLIDLVESASRAEVEAMKISNLSSYH